MAKEFDASLNVMGYDRNVTVKINGVQFKDYGIDPKTYHSPGK